MSLRKLVYARVRLILACYATMLHFCRSLRACSYLSSRYTAAELGAGGQMKRIRGGRLKHMLGDISTGHMYRSLRNQAP